MEVVEDLGEQMSSKYNDELAVYLAYYSSRKMEAVLSSETLVNIYQTTLCHIMEYSILHVTAAGTSNITESLVILIQVHCVSPHSIQDNNGNVNLK
jgi:hypothetical protein